MRFAVLFFFAIFLAATALFAQEVDPNTRAGLARIESDTDGTRYLMVGSTRIDLPDRPYTAFIEKRLGDLLLVAYSQGGNACPAFYTWVHATPGNIRRSEGFGTCSDLITVTYDAETVSVTMGSMQPGKGDITYVYDGKNPIREVQNGLAKSGMANASDWGFWDGKYPYDLITAGELQGTFLKLLGDASTLVEAQTLLSFSGPMDRDGDWIAGTGCAPQLCEESAGAIAVNVVTGHFLVALWRAGTPARAWGALGDSTPQSILDVLARR
ncbi:MAG TPA: hypothetical protein ENK28_03905 [Aliiroseovarius sp.]|nr:hypothetical protein [Aliiroseovarius sp.]